MYGEAPAEKSLTQKDNKGGCALLWATGDPPFSSLPPTRSAIAAGLHGYNGVLVGLLMAVFSDKGDYFWWLLLPVIVMSMSW